MPWAPKKPCAERGCPQLTSTRYCPDHQEQAAKREKDRKTAFDRTRPSASIRGYTSDFWRKRRAEVFKRDPWCMSCTTSRSTHADHKVPRARGGTDDLDNLQGLCRSCHSRKTAREDSGFTKRRR